MREVATREVPDTVVEQFEVGPYRVAEILHHGFGVGGETPRAVLDVVPRNSETVNHKLGVEAYVRLVGVLAPRLDVAVAH